MFIISAKRTAFGNFAGSLMNLTAAELGEHVAKAALISASVKPDQIDHVIFGIFYTLLRYNQINF